MQEDFSVLVGSRLKEIRILTGYSVSQLAGLFECTEDHYRRIERGIYTLSIERLARLYTWAGIDPLFLLTGKRRWLEETADAEDKQVKERMNVMKQLIGYCNTVAKEG